MYKFTYALGVVGKSLISATFAWRLNVQCTNVVCSYNLQVKARLDMRTYTRIRIQNIYDSQNVFTCETKFSLWLWLKYHHSCIETGPTVVKGNIPVECRRGGVHIYIMYIQTMLLVSYLFGRCFANINI